MFYSKLTLPVLQHFLQKQKVELCTVCKTRPRIVANREEWNFVPLGLSWVISEPESPAHPSATQLTKARGGGGVGHEEKEEGEREEAVTDFPIREISI